MSVALEKGIALGKANRKGEALEYFKQALRENPREVQAWLWISQLVDDRPTQKYCYQKVLEIEPDNFMANQFLNFIKGTDTHVNFIPKDVSPLQTDLESRRPVESTSKREDSLPVSSTGSSSRPANLPQTSHPTQSKPKERKRATWTIYLLIMLLATCLISTGMYFTMEYFPRDIDLGNGTYTNVFTIVLMVLQGLVALAWGIYWMISGYLGVFNLIKKGYILEYVGCSILLAGIPFVLPALLGPFMQIVVDSVQEKRQ